MGEKEEEEKKSSCVKDKLDPLQEHQRLTNYLPGPDMWSKETTPSSVVGLEAWTGRYATDLRYGWFPPKPPRQEEGSQKTDHQRRTGAAPLTIA